MSKTACAHLLIQLTLGSGLYGPFVRNAIKDRCVFNTLLVLLSARVIRRIGQNAPVRKLPSDLIRLTAGMLPMKRKDG